MDLEYIKKLVRLLDSTSLTSIEIEEDGKYIKLKKESKIPKLVTTQINPQSQIVENMNTISVPAKTETVKQETKEEKSSSKLHEIKSPIVGTFYRAPTPEADSYVRVGDKISVGSVMCIIEAMKLMNEIESDVAGKLIKILVENGTPIEYGQPLFLIEVE